jgi:3-deoxy-D-manno-octulosonate 8-phosphate phosphatase (KDO 8-P phosphatase)
MDNILAYFTNIKHFIFDIDGVLTDGSLIISHDGIMLRTMDIKDGYALQLAIKKGYTITIISGAKNDLVETRLNRLGITDIYINIENKLAKLNELISQNKLHPEAILYMGDDMPDWEVMKHLHFATCPNDACNDIKQISKYVSPYNGGKGCVRDVIEKVLKLNNDWE